MQNCLRFFNLPAVAWDEISYYYHLIINMGVEGGIRYTELKIGTFRNSLLYNLYLDSVAHTSSPIYFEGRVVIHTIPSLFPRLLTADEFITFDNQRA